MYKANLRGHISGHSHTRIGWYLKFNGNIYLVEAGSEQQQQQPLLCGGTGAMLQYQRVVMEIVRPIRVQQLNPPVPGPSTYCCTNEATSESSLTCIVLY